MTMDRILLGTSELNNKNAKVKGGFIEIEGEEFYKIENFNHMPDFFMTIVSDSNHWMFISSNGSLSAGRKNRDNALFPYYTDDKIHDYCGITGSKTFFIVEREDKNFLWEPFSREFSAIYGIQRNIYKSIYGNKIIFEEINNDLELAFQYGWYTSDQFGFVKKSQLTNLGAQPVKVDVLDGIKNILPSGIDYIFQNEYSNLADGYKKSELIESIDLGLFMLSSIPVDRAEPSESLNATSVWSHGLGNRRILISDHQVDKFTRGLGVETELDVRASRGAYYVNASIVLAPKQSEKWMLVAEINQSTTDIANLSYQLKEKESLASKVVSDIKVGTDKLIKIVASADGLQSSNEELGSARHFSNTMYNVMRGGIYLDNYSIDASDFRKFVDTINKQVSKKFEAELTNLPATISNHDLIQLAENTNNADFIRICYEYLPLTFSRRHGDPSRPWNQFSIDTKNEDGTAKSDFQGNWRDIFQNWEALSLSYPEFIENIISKFVNASTPDGYNPYRIMRNGIDWECPDPDDPWAYIGYWGDHQIIYLQKLFELSNHYHPGKLEELLAKDIFAYANVPYRIKGYSDIVKNPQDTIEFDADLNDQISKLVEEIGADGRLLINDKGVYHVNLTEKILVTLLSKLSNFIPEAGIWLNTQRPEWNDANNALVGSGVSMVTLYYIRRFLSFWKELFSTVNIDSIAISEEVKTLFDSIYNLLNNNRTILESGFSDEQRRYFTDVLGKAGETYRNSVYTQSFSGNKQSVTPLELANFADVALEYMDQSIQANKREDGLYHSYNLIKFTGNGVSIRYLYEMLEGQVAVLSAGSLSVKEALNVFDSLKQSKLFREDQYSYILYPDRQLPRFTEKNNIPDSKVKASKLLSQLVNQGDSSVVSADSNGHYHFNSAFRNADMLAEALDELSEGPFAELLASEKAMVLDIYEEMFDHQSFTGRSGTFYAYEGLGSIYWHMVSKLLLAAEEYFFRSVEEGVDADTMGQLKNHYYEIKAGIGLYKSPELYGAFPTDAYSHTPGNAGVKQPGMTGQVKEDVISRMGELGVIVVDGKITFNTSLLNKNEFLKKSKDFEFIALSGNKEVLPLQPSQLGFTICQVPVVYTLGNEERISIYFHNNKVETLDGLVISEDLSQSIFRRQGDVVRIEISIKE
jgi:hypothetical protein